MPQSPVSSIKTMPDIASDARASVAGELDWVGMDNIEIPVKLATPEGEVSTVAHVSAMVDLEQPEVRGIHMSRLYLELDRVLSEEPLQPKTLRDLLHSFLDSHSGLSTRARVFMKFDYMVRRAALKSDNSGWRRYPAYLSATYVEGNCRIEMGMEVTYSSTCPCSAALARQIIQDNFREKFGASSAISYEDVLTFLGSESDMAATPHSQRSSAQVRLVIAPSFGNFPFLDVIDRIENALKTPVQTAVKREDEQAFARLNGENLMFCEDAARRIQRALNDCENVRDFWARASHHESLHPHDAVAITTKRLDGGFTADQQFPLR